MSPRVMRIIGWVLTGLLAAFLLGPSAGGKFADFEGKQEMFDHIGFSVDLVQKIGVLEVILVVLFLLPWTSFVGAILLTAYLGGAVVTHVRVGDAFVFPIVIGVLVWIALGLRQPEIFRLAIGKRLTA